MNLVYAYLLASFSYTIARVSVYTFMFAIYDNYSNQVYQQRLSFQNIFACKHIKYHEHFHGIASVSLWDFMLS
jgi:hypothetical protein